MVTYLPGHVYWKDIHGRYLWCNLQQAQDLNFKHCEELIGKTDYDFPSKILADQFKAVDEKVIHEKREIEVEEKVSLGKGLFLRFDCL